MMNHLKYILLLLIITFSSNLFSQEGAGRYVHSPDQFVISQPGFKIKLSKMTNEDAISFTLAGLEKYRINDSLDLGIYLYFNGKGGEKETSEVFLSYHGYQTYNRITIYKEMLIDDMMFKPGTLSIEVRDMDDKVLRKYQFELTE